MPAEADVAGRETEAFGDLGSGRRRTVEPFGQPRKLEIGRERATRAVAHDADDVADPFLQHDAQILSGQQIGSADMRNEAGRAHGRVAGEGQFAAGREDPQPRRVGRGPRLEHEHGLGEVEFARDRLHAAVVEAVGIEHHGERIALERRLGEHVEREEAARHRR